MYMYIYISFLFYYSPVQAAWQEPQAGEFAFDVQEFLAFDRAKGLTTKPKNVASRGYIKCRTLAKQFGLEDQEARVEVDLRISHMSH